jgi:hypothetical protein
MASPMPVRADGAAIAAVEAAADRRGIADPPEQGRGDAAGRRGDGETALRVASHGADGSASEAAHGVVPRHGVVPEAVEVAVVDAGQHRRRSPQRLQRLPMPLLRPLAVELGLGQAEPAGEPVGALAGDAPVRRLRDGGCELDGVLRVAHRGDGAERAGAVHHRRRQLEGLSVKADHGAASGVEAAVVLERDHRGDGGIEGRTTGTQRGGRLRRRVPATVEVLPVAGGAAVRDHGPAFVDFVSGLRCSSAP